MQTKQLLAETWDERGLLWRHRFVTQLKDGRRDLATVRHFIDAEGVDKFIKALENVKKLRIEVHRFLDEVHKITSGPGPWPPRKRRPPLLAASRRYSDALEKLVLRYDEELRDMVLVSRRGLFVHADFIPRAGGHFKAFTKMLKALPDYFLEPRLGPKPSGKGPATGGSMLLVEEQKKAIRMDRQRFSCAVIARELLKDQNVPERNTDEKDRRKTVEEKLHAMTEMVRNFLARHRPHQRRS